nr:Putative uncharacterized protein [Moritella viscosa]SHO18808.1 Putative uncharacterized protein [Moritella viscosa]
MTKSSLFSFPRGIAFIYQPPPRFRRISGEEIEKEANLYLNFN